MWTPVAPPGISKNFHGLPENPMGPPDAARNRPWRQWAISGGVRGAHGIFWKSKEILGIPRGGPMAGHNAARNHPLAPWAISGGIRGAHGISVEFRGFPENPMGPPNAARNRPWRQWAISLDFHGFLGAPGNPTFLRARAPSARKTRWVGNPPSSCGVSWAAGGEGRRPGAARGVPWVSSNSHGFPWISRKSHGPP